MPEATPISVRGTLSGKHVLVTGGSGFLGKVFIALLLEKVPDIGRIYVFMRPRSLVRGRSRFENILNTSPVFAPLHDQYGANFNDFLASRLEVVEGVLEENGLGFSPALAARLHNDLDLIVHSAGLVDFNPDLGKAIASNVDATMNVAHFAEQCAHASLLHISTCYVAGHRSGLIEERLCTDRAPNGTAFDAVAEVRQARAAVASIRTEFEPGGQREASIVADVQAELGPSATDQQVRNHARKRVREALRDALSDEGMSRASALGFPNTYTYTKFIAECLLSFRRGKLAYCVFRPSIVESAVSFPFPSWNESFNGSAPLAYVMGTWYRMVPARPEAPFDIIPVDEVCKAMAICSSALLQERHAEVYQVGTSQRHRCSVGRAADLVALSYRKFYRERERSRGDRVLKSRWNAVLVHPDHILGVQGLSNGLRLARDVIDIMPDKLRDKMSRLETRLDEFDDKLADIRKMVELYMPFMYENAYVFESKAIDTHPALEVEFEFCPEKVDWRHYWLDIHMPGLRRYAFPLIEGKRPERYRAPNRATLPPSPEEDGQSALHAAYVIAHESLFPES